MSAAAEPFADGVYFGLDAKPASIVERYAQDPRVLIAVMRAAAADGAHLSVDDFLLLFGEWIYPEPNSGCWIWAGRKTPAGYGHIHAEKHTLYVHRIACEVRHGPGSTKGLFALHSCDTPPCVNPDHLRPGTSRDNCRDTLLRNRNRPVVGSAHPKAVLTDELALLIRQMASDGVYISEIARRVGISISVCSNVARGISYKGIGSVPHVIVKGKPPHPGWGENAPRALLTCDQVTTIRSRLASGERGADLAREYGV